MPRRRRLVVEGGVYHVYNRFARGEAIFADAREAERFVDLLGHVRERDGLTVLAWCLMSTHYHLAVRLGAVPLARTMAHVQARFSMDLNRRRRSSGPLWQSRYKAKMVTDKRHLLQLIAYVHLNPVVAGLVADPAGYVFSGHHELIGRTESPLVDVDGVLQLFGKTERAARRSYVTLLGGTRREAWRGEGPGRLPWWQREPDRRLEGEVAAPQLDPLGRTAGLERRAIEAAEFVQRACGVLGDPVEEVVGGGASRAATKQRYLIAAVAIERWRVPTGRLAGVFGRLPEVVSRWVARAGELRVSDADFRDACEALDAALAASGEPSR
jgi:REP element-mobilizing transposase RayT